ncbi:hypothetical protein IW261DRAFT_1124401 [Armillaria novae-zelandiae]|uniref:Uncharacterized protein n=1 Tax=Armillaria novae-zelandiae TaxID=153914 RepID=A0AA39NHZ0_9AGAR|nr:hypothetical protein IW261DRAFT_1124401 [Armillaria novae-zelandiae]
MNVFRRKPKIVPSDSPNTLSPALSSLSMPAQAVGSPSNDAASVKREGKGKGILRRFGLRDKRGHTDSTGHPAAALPNSESSALQSNRSTVASLDNAQTMTTKALPDDTHVAHTLSGNKTANAIIILGIVQTIFEALDAVPYVGMVAGLASTAIKEVDTCKEEWDKVKATLLKIRDIVLGFRHGRDDSAPLPDDVRSAFQELEICLRDILEAVQQYQDVNVGRRVLGRSALKAEAILCVGRIDIAVKVFQMKVLIGTRLVGDQTYNLVKEIFAILHLLQQGSLPSLSLNLDVLPCPASSQYFTGRKSDLQKLSRMLAAPVVTLSGMNSDALLAFVRRFEHSPRLVVSYCVAWHY